MNENTKYWLAGLLEGEGYFGVQTETQPVRIALQMTDEDVVAKVAKLWGVSYFTVKPQKEHHKVAYRCFLRGKPAVEQIKQLKPLMGERRAYRMEDCIKSYKCKVTTKLTTKQAYYESRIKGNKVADIAKKYGVSTSMVYKRLKPQKR